MDDEGVKRRRIVAESLGWLTESTILPRKHRSIAGVGASSILELKAHLYRSQEESKNFKQFSERDVAYHRARKKITPRDAFSEQNRGVLSRDSKDKLELKAVNDGSASYAALEKKAELYDKLVRREISDEEDNEKYCVDFFRKGIEEQPPQPQACDSPVVQVDDYVDGGDVSLASNTKHGGLGRAVGPMDRDEHKRLVSEVHEEVNEAREKASQIKLRRQELVAARREKLKQAYLHKKLEKLKAITTVTPN